MKKLIFCCALLFITVTRGNSQSKMFTLQMNLTPKSDGATVYLTNNPNGANPLDSAVVKNGRVTFKHTTPYPQMFTILVQDSRDKHNRKYIPIFIDGGDVKSEIVLDERMSAFNLAFYSLYPIEKVKVTGSRSHDQYVEFIKTEKPIRDELQKVYDAANKSENYEKGVFKMPSPETIKLINETDKALGRLKQFGIDYIMQHSSDPVTLHIAGMIVSGLKAQQIDQVINAVSPTLLFTVPGKKFWERAQLIKRTAVGAQFVDLDLLDEKGKPVKLSNHVGKGKYTMIDFWASWCSPCRSDIPHLKKVYELYQEKGFDMISLSMDDDKSKWLKALDEEKMPWVQVSDLKGFGGHISELYNFIGIPTCILIGPDGAIVSRNMRGSRLDKKLLELYGNNFDK